MALCRGLSSLRLAAASLFFYNLLPLGASAVIREPECTVSSIEGGSCNPSTPQIFAPENVAKETWKEASDEPDSDVLLELLQSIGVMQDDYFAPWLGTWPTSIDWTGAVMGTHVSGTLRSFTAALDAVRSSADPVEDWKLKENLIENYFTQVVSYYFGENDLDIRMEAYDDILWVVLGWLEAVRFVNEHTALHYQLGTQRGGPGSQNTGEVGEILRNQTWHGNLWIPAFSHRARVFWDLASKGWDTELCGGGMTWNPRLLPYKNAITNELFIAGSISMYLYFPGDANTAPFSQTETQREVEQQTARDPKYLKAAVDGYKWLVNSNMTDTQGLFTDGFHISGYANPASNNTRCDERNDMVFTYNQGVVLTGQRGLWEATGALSYLLEGHLLIQNVINATGYDLARNQPRDDYTALAPDTVPKWYGLGRLGVIEDNCDASGSCSQDGQTFKGIFFHHLTYFCAPLSLPPPEVDRDAFDTASKSHAEACRSYTGWLKWNAEAALNTRDAAGKFGMWFTAGLLTNLTAAAWPTVDDQHVAGVDYRNYGVPNDTTWQRPSGDGILDPGKKMPVGIPIMIPTAEDDSRQQQPIDGGATALGQVLAREEQTEKGSLADDPNNRGRGRTVETQGSGLALIRAYWSILQLQN
ncbi:hypothetical protein G7054_g7925 [Neopestalotiopsis clavispora]|nr:hypothetical protein G7054_g7925 [Neopestalotiopsis clavispora]